VTIRLVDKNTTPAMTPTELKEWGDDKLGEARRAAVEAVAASMHSEFLERGKSVTRADIRRWRGRARTAIDAWRKVESLTTEVLNEIERAEEQARTDVPR
jgi:hypothetical protein